MSLTQPGAEDASLDPNAGGTYRDKPIWDVETIAENLNRSGYDWYTNNYGELDDGVLNFGFWLNLQELNNSYYVNETSTIAFNEAYYGGDFSPFNAAQQDVARKAISLWGDLVDIDFRETKSGDADLTYANTFTGGAQAYAYLPFGDVDDAAYYEIYGFNEAGRLGGDVWIDGYVASNFFPLTDSYYAVTTMIHETGHALGLSHPGDYNATDDNDGDGVPDPITYEGDAFFAQDSLQYSIMSYFDGYETGAQFVDFELLNFAYPATPMVHDIAAIQAIYGVNLETRTGDDTYGFNSTLEGTAYDFTANTRPVISIWDADGNDTLDVSGFKTDSVINLNEGAFSSAGGASRFYTLEEVNAAREKLGFAARTQETFDYYQDLIERLGITNPQFKDNISIAYGATIENATTGRGDDKIIVNDLANVVRGGRGMDTVSYETAESAVHISLKAGVVAEGTADAPNGAAGDSLFSIEGAIGSRFSDTILGTAADNVLDGLRGDDVLNGRGGSDTYVFRNGVISGEDTIVNFRSDDLIAVQKALTADEDGIVAVTDKTLVLDASDGDSVTFRGAAPTELTLVGRQDGFFYYAAVGSEAAAKAGDKLASIADTIEEVDAATKAQIAHAQSNDAVQDAPGQFGGNMAARVEGWAEAHGTPTRENTEGFLQRVEFEEPGHDHDHGAILAGARFDPMDVALV
jgi:Ca2+-binding RTX toxin-like protein